MKNSRDRIYVALLVLIFGSYQVMAQVTDNGQSEIVQFEDAESWMQNYDAQFSEEIRGHLYGEKALYQLLEETDVTAVKIYNAEDQEGQRKLVFQGIGTDASEVGLAFDVSRACPPVCGGGGLAIAEIGAPISPAQAQMMISQFALSNPESPSSYTFDATSLRQVLEQPQCEGLFLAYGVDGQTNPQLILIGLSAEGELLKEGDIIANPQVGYSSLLTVQN